MHRVHDNYHQMSLCATFLFISVKLFDAFAPTENNAEITFNVSLGYRDNMDSEWQAMAYAEETRKLKCVFNHPKVGSLQFLLR